MTADKWIYTGEKFRNFLHRNGISYKEAAATLGIDKNTVGKAVRGGNMNVDILLRICNEYGLRMTDFFAVERNGDKDYLNSLDEGSPVLEECNQEYKKCELTSSEVVELCPEIGRASVENALKKLCDDGIIEKHGGGRSVFYSRKS